MYKTADFDERSNKRLAQVELIVEVQ